MTAESNLDRADPISPIRIRCSRPARSCFFEPRADQLKPWFHFRGPLALNLYQRNSFQGKGFPAEARGGVILTQAPSRPAA